MQKAISTKLNKRDLRFAKTLAKYADKWVALRTKEKHIVASGNTLREVQERLALTKARDYIFHFVEKYPLAM